jgi:hypothetical protein
MGFRYRTPAHSKKSTQVGRGASRKLNLYAEKTNFYDVGIFKLSSMR